MNISIITDFGCDCNCFYCVWRDHKLSNLKCGINYNKLEKFLLKYKYKGKVSLSGGGDPLYDYFNNLKFWTWIIKFTKSHNIKLDIHTRVKLTKQNFWKRHVNLCAFSSDKLEDDKEYLIYLSKLTKVRVIHVVTSKDTIDIINEYAKFCNQNNLQLTLKELYGFEDNGNYDKFKSIFKDVYFLDNSDYNIYYMPDNNVYNKFLIKRGD